MEYRAVANTQRLLELFARRGVRCTFFVLGWVARKSPELIREIHSAGHEVACHGMSHRLVYQQTPDEFRSETRDSKALLEDLLGTRVNGYRAATYSITRQSLWALDILVEQGFTYDSSIFPINHDLYGIPDAPLRPGTIRTPSGYSLVEFPLSTSKLFGLQIPVAGGGYFRILPYWLTRLGLARLNERERCPFVFYLHPWEVDPGQPVVRAGWRSRLRHYTNLGRTYKRLERLMGQFSFGTMSEVLAGLGLTQNATQSAPVLATSPA
jgi:polysaccharide deacetylase family protein (PEP-CTERM system associated)